MFQQETFLGRGILVQSVMRKTYQLSIPTVKKYLYHYRPSHIHVLIISNEFTVSIVFSCSTILLEELV